LNAYVLWVNRASVPHVWRRVVPMIVGLATRRGTRDRSGAPLQPAWLKLATFIVLLPLILLQAAGFRRPIRDERRVGLFLRRRPRRPVLRHDNLRPRPLAVMLSNQGFTKQDFRAGLGLVRLAESTFTAVAYYFAGMFFNTERRPASLYPPEPGRRDPARRTDHTPSATGDLQARLHELRRLGRRLWHLDTAATATPHRIQRRVLRLAAVGMLDIWLLYRFFHKQALEDRGSGDVGQPPLRVATHRRSTTSRPPTEHRPEKREPRARRPQRRQRSVDGRRRAPGGRSRRIC